MSSVYSFGSSLKKVEQQDKSPKKVFVLGVYASAVHAKWIGTDGKVKVTALAVASEPNIFWKGENAEEIIDQISIPSDLGKLVAADERFNGPSGKALDDLFLTPLGYSRDDAWLCDLLPYSRINPNQLKAIESKYNTSKKDFNLPECTIPQFSPGELKEPSRVEEIIAELEQSQADTLILLGDLPIKHFLSEFADQEKLSDFGKSKEDYGKPVPIIIREKTYQVIPLVHPRQAGNLGNSSLDWSNLHKHWVITRMSENFPKNDSKLIRLNSKPNYCPVCGSGKIATYLRGMPLMTKKLENDIKEGKVILGGCCISDDDPFCKCVECKTDFYKNLF